MTGPGRPRRLAGADAALSAAIVYGCLAAFIAAVYALVVAGLGSLAAGSLARAGTNPNLGLSILATALVAVGFPPVRGRAQRLASRLVYGRRATPYEALSEFAGRMGGTYATEDLLPRMARVLAEGTGAARADVWLRSGPQVRAAASWPPAAPPAPPVPVSGDETPRVDGADRVVPVRHQGELLGVLSVAKPDGLTPAEDKLLADLGAQAGLILRNVGLTEELRGRLAELQASRQRIVAAQDEQRRRIERDIRDGAQQQLAGIAAKLALAESVAGQDEDKDRALVAEIKADTRGTLETLRELARGVFPPLLADEGLAAAVAALAGKAPMPVTVDTAGIGRYPAEIETAVYFCCAEALRNAARHAGPAAARHAGPAAARLRLADSGEKLSFTVADDGPGFDPAAAAPGSGLQHMSDRLAAVGGALEIDSWPGSGTTVTGRIPHPPSPVTGCSRGQPRSGPAPR